MNGLHLPFDRDRGAFVLGHPMVGRLMKLQEKWASRFGRTSSVTLFTSALWHFDTVYVMVDTKNFSRHQAPDPGLPHWPAAVAWWESREVKHHGQALLSLLRPRHYFPLIGIG